MEEGKRDEQFLEESHEATKKQLKDEIDKLTKQYKKILETNKKEEKQNRSDYVKSANNYQENMNSYDYDMKTNTTAIEKIQKEYDESYADLQGVKEEYSMRMEEKRKRDEIAEIMRKKNETENNRMERLVKASEYIQAHWRGLLARKDAEKARKGKKKKKKKWIKVEISKTFK